MVLLPIYDHIDLPEINDVILGQQKHIFKELETNREVNQLHTYKLETQDGSKLAYAVSTRSIMRPH
jgi:hypothetical protein